MPTEIEIRHMVASLRFQKGQAVPNCPSGARRPDDLAHLLQKTILCVKGQGDFAAWHQLDGELGHQAAPADVPDRPAEVPVRKLRHSTHDWQCYFEPGESALAEECVRWAHEDLPRRLPAKAASRVTRRAFWRRGLRTHA